MKAKRKRYSKEVIQQVIAEYEAGSSIAELKRRYEITGGQTVQNWIKRYSKEGLRHEVVHIQTDEERNHIQDLEKRVDMMEKLLERMTFEKLKYEALIEIFEETQQRQVA